MTASKTPRPVGFAILTVSDTRTVDEDTSGDLLQERVLDAGHHLHARALVPDASELLRNTLAQWIASAEIEAVLLTGGTGLTGRDGTPEVIDDLCDKPIPGFGELFRWLSFRDIGTSTIQSRATAGVSNGTLLFALPGSTNACRTAWDEILQPQFDIDHRPCNFVQILGRLVE